MAQVELVLVLLAASVALRMLAERWRVPYATLLVIGGLALAAVPELPRVAIAPDVLFLIFVPPLLYWGAAMVPLRDLRREAGPILRLAVGMVLVSTTAIAIVVHAIDPAFTWPAAFALGAIIAPPDPVAVLAVTRWVRLPGRVEDLLEGEGLLNDATALVLYRIAVAAAVTGVFSPAWAAFELPLVGIGGVIVGLGIGMVSTRLRRLTRGIDVADATILLLIPFAAYLTAEGLHVSGVIAVVAAAMYVSRSIQSAGTPAMRLQSLSVWTIMTFILESLIFILTGLELPYVMRDLNLPATGALLREAAIVYVCVVVVRQLWVFPSAYIGHAIGRRVRGSTAPYPSWRQVLFVGWAGVRGGDSVVIAMALPIATAAGNPFPARGRIIFITFSVVLATLVIHGPTLRPLARVLGLRGDRTAEDEEALARVVSEEAGLRALDAAAEASPDPEVARYLRAQHRTRARRWAEAQARRDRAPVMSYGTPLWRAAQRDHRRAAEYRRLRTAMIDKQRLALYGLRDGDEIGDDTMRRVQRELDLEDLLLEASEPSVDVPSEAPPED